MKKTFRNILAGAVALLAVSCYDDSALRKQNELLKDEISNLKESLVDVSEFGIDRENGVYLPFEASKTIQLTAENIAEYSVMNEPDGWKASIEGTSLVITAPSKSAYDLGAAALTGEISIHATSNKGACKVAKLAVEAGYAIRLTVDAEGNAIVKNASTVEGANGTEFASFAIGIMSANTYYHFDEMGMGTFEDAWNMYGYMFGNMWPTHSSYYEIVEKPAYVDGTNEVHEATVNLNELYFTYLYEDLPKGSYVVFAFPVDAEYKMAGDIAEAIYVDHAWGTPEITATHNDVIVNLEAAGADYYLIGVVPAYKYKYIQNPTFDAYMNLAQEGPWEGFSKYGATYGMGVQKTVVPSSFSVSEIMAEVSGNAGEKLMYNETYNVWVMPIFDHMVKADVDAYGDPAYDFSAYDYDTHFKPYAFEVKTADLTAGGPATVIAAGAAAYDNVSATITLAEGQTAYWGLLSEADYAALDPNADEYDAQLKEAISTQIYDALVPGLPSPALTATGTVSADAEFGSTEKWYFVAFTVDADGKAGLCSTVEVAPKSLVRDENIKVELTSLVEEGNNYKATFAVTGATNVVLYNISADANGNNSYSINAVEKALVTNTGSIARSIVKAAVTDGVATLTFKKDDYKTDMFVWGYTVDSNNALDKLMTEPAIINIASSLPQAN